MSPAISVRTAEGSAADGVERVDDQALMATGLDLNGPPNRFSTKEMLENLEIPGF
jgi:hypothetical protein